jgi:hypothetical protein
MWPIASFAASAQKRPLSEQSDITEIYEYAPLVFALDSSNRWRLRRIFLIQDHHLFSWSRPRSPEAIGVLMPLFRPGRCIAVPVVSYRFAQESSFRVDAPQASGRGSTIHRFRLCRRCHT